MSLVSLVSAILGYAIVVGSAIVKLPQFITIIRSRSAEGISLMGHLIETSIYSVSLSWGVAKGLDISTYGETIPVFAQVVALDLLIGYFNKQMVPAVAGVAALGLLTYLLSIEALPLFLHEALYGAQVPLIISSRLSQIYLNYRRKSTGKLSFTTAFLTFGGAAARVLTTMVGVSWEKGKLVMMAAYGASVLMNGLILVQFLLYGGAPFFRPLSKHAKKRSEDTETKKVTAEGRKSTGNRKVPQKEL